MSIKLLVIQFLVVAMVMTAPPAIANPLQGYCFTQSGIRQESTSFSPKTGYSAYSVKEPVQVSFQV